MPLKKTIPVPSILSYDVDELDEELNKALTLYTDGLDEFVSFGTHIFKWELDREDIREENIPIIALFRRILELADSIATLLKARTADPCEILLRSLFEVSLNLEYILVADSDRRALCYLFAGYIDQLKFNKRHDPNDPNYNSYKMDYKHGHVFKEVPEFKNLAEKIAYFEGWIDRPEHREVKVEYERVKALKATAWFSPFSDLTNKDDITGQGKLLRNIKDLARHLNKFDLYEILYKEWSKAVHGSDVITGKFFGNKKGISMLSLRQVIKAHAVVTLTFRLLEVTIELITKRIKASNKEQYGEIIWWAKAFHTNYGRPIINNEISFEEIE